MLERGIFNFCFQILADFLHYHFGYKNYIDYICFKTALYRLSNKKETTLKVLNSAGI